MRLISTIQIYEGLQKPLWALFFTGWILLSSTSLQAEELPKSFPFSEENALKEWEEKIFKGKVLYVVSADDKAESAQDLDSASSFLLAQSEKTCSGLFYEVKFHPASKPMASWKWKVVSFPTKSTREGTSGEWVEQDDFAARFYVIFPKFPFTYSESIEYIWDEDLPEGTIIESPFFKNIKLFVIQSGKEQIGQWVYEERNIHEDYIKAFGRPPESKVGAIAIMTDSDNTLSTAEAYYDEIKVGYEKDETK